jgi:hypothetical protein
MARIKEGGRPRGPGLPHDLGRVPRSRPEPRTAARRSSHDAGRSQLRNDIPPPGTPLDRERGILAAVEPGQPGPQVLPVSRGDL